MCVYVHTILREGMKVSVKRESEGYLRSGRTSGFEIKALQDIGAGCCFQ